MRAVDVRVGRDDEAVVAQLVDVEVGSDAGAQRGDQRGDLLAGDQAVKARLLDVQHLGAAAGWPGTCGRGPCLAEPPAESPSTMYSSHSAGSFSWQSASLPGRPAPSSTLLRRVISRALRAASRRAGGLDDLGAQRLGVVGVFQQPGFQRAGHGFFDGRAHFAGDQLVLGLAAELGFGHLHRQHAGQAFAHVVAGRLDLGLLGQLVVGDVLVDDAGHGRAQAGQVRAAVALRDVVGEAQHAFAVAVVPLHRHFHAHRHAAGRGLGGDRTRSGAARSCCG